MDVNEKRPEPLPPPAGPPEPRIEERDVDVRSVGKFAAALVALCVVALVLLFGLMKYFLKTETADKGTAPVFEGVKVDARKLPPEPRLQDSPVLDLKEMRAVEDSVLAGYGWVDQSKGTVHIPIGLAMDLVAQRGLPARAQAPAPGSTASVPTESGLGPKLQQPGGPLAGELAQGQTPAN
jgi:hypothetical protein